MELMNVLLENENMQASAREKENEIMEAAQVYNDFPQEIKTHITENLEQFIGEDTKETYNNIKTFTEGAVFQLLHEMSDQLAA